MELIQQIRFDCYLFAVDTKGTGVSFDEPKKMGWESLVAAAVPSADLRTSTGLRASRLAG